MNKTYFWGVFLGGFSFVISLLQGIILVPFILDKWGAEKYGFWLSSMAFIVLMRTIDSGHQIFVSNEFTKEYYIDKKNAMNVLGSGLKVALLLSSIQFFIFFIFLILNKLNLILGFVPDTRTILGILAMLLMWFIVGSISGIIVKIILPAGLYNRTVVWGIINKIIEILILIFSIFYSLRIADTFFLLAGVQFISTIIMLWDVKTQLPEFYPWWKLGSVRAGIKNMMRSQMITLNGFIEQFSTNGLLILIGNFISVASIPVFTTLRTASNVFLQANQIFISPLVPKMVQLHQEKKSFELARILIQNWFLLNFIILLPIIGGSPFLKYLYIFWTKDKLEFDEALALTLMASIVIISFGKIIMYYLSAINHLKALTSTNVIRIVLLFPLAYFFLWYWKDLTSLGYIICFTEVFASLLLPIYFINIELPAIFIAKTLIWLLLPLFLIIPYLGILIFFHGINKEIICIFGLMLFLLIFYFQYKYLNKHFTITLFARMRLKNQ